MCAAPDGDMPVPDTNAGLKKRVGYLTTCFCNVEGFGWNKPKPRHLKVCPPKA